MIPVLLAALVFLVLSFSSLQAALISAGIVWLASFVIGLIISNKIDNPPAKVYDLHPPGCWSQMVKALQLTRTHETGWHIHVNESQPPPNQPIHINASYPIRMPYEDHHKGILSPDQCKSALFVDIYITPQGPPTQVLYRWKPVNALSRLQHNLVIQDTTLKADQLIRQTIQGLNG